MRQGAYRARSFFSLESVIVLSMDTPGEMNAVSTSTSPATGSAHGSNHALYVHLIDTHSAYRVGLVEVALLSSFHQIRSGQISSVQFRSKNGGVKVDSGSRQALGFSETCFKPREVRQLP